MLLFTENTHFTVKEIWLFVTFPPYVHIPAIKTNYNFFFFGPPVHLSAAPPIQSLISR